MNTRLKALCAGFAVIFILAGCEKLSDLNKPSAEEILRSYLNASLEGKSAEAYRLASSEDRLAKSLDEYVSENSAAESPLAAAIAGRMKFEVLSVVETGNKASAQVEVTGPDFSALFADIMGAAFSSAFGDKDESDIESELVKKFESGQVPTITEHQEFQLVKEDDGWKVFLDWKGQKAKREKDEKVASLLSEAEGLRDSNKLHGAVAKYEEVLALDSEMVEAQKGLAEANQEIEAFEEKQAYIANVVLKDFQVAEGQRYGFGDAVPGVFGTIINNGDRSLKEVEITVYFLDQNGTAISEADFHPVLVTKYSFSGDNKPLKPNYVRDFGYSVEDSAPSSWSKKATAKITNIEFE